MVRLLPWVILSLKSNTLCCKGERRQWRIQRTEAGAAVAECEGLLSPKHDAGTATRHWRAFWQRRCRAAAAGAVLKPSGGNCAVLPECAGFFCRAHAGGHRKSNNNMPYFHFGTKQQKYLQNRLFVFNDRRSFFYASSALYNITMSIRPKYLRCSAKNAIIK